MPPAGEDAVKSFYDGVFPFYEKANLFLTLGVIRFWRRKATEEALKHHPGNCIDLCCGTGEFAARIRNLSPSLPLTCLDFNENMLSAAKAKVENADFVLSDATELPFPENSFDLAVMSFGARNLETEGRLVPALRETLRVLKPGGFFVNLETNVPENAFLKFLFELYVGLVFFAIKILKPRSKVAYSYLKKSVKSFYSPRELKAILKKIGFVDIRSEKLFFSSSLIISGKK